MKTKINLFSPAAIRPIDFDFNSNKGRLVKMNTTEGISFGVLVSFEDNMITLKSPSKSKIPAIAQFDYSEIQTIILN